jgi:hypothetical protein
MSAASQFYVSGPADTWIGTAPYVWSGSNTWTYVGYTQRGMDIQIIPSYEDIPVDYAGNQPGDVWIGGQEGRASCIMTRYNEPVIMDLASFGSGTPGEFGNNFIGSLVTTEGLSFPLLIYSPYGVKAVYGSSGSPMVPGFLFFSSYFADPLAETLSIRPKTPTIGFRAVPVFGSYSGSSFTAGAAPFNASLLYTNTMPSPLPTPN